MTVTTHTLSPWTIVGAAFGLASSRHETNQGAAAARRAGLLERLRAVAPDIAEGFDLAEPPVAVVGANSRLRYLKEVVAFTNEIYEKISRDVYAVGRRPVVVGGDHSISIGTVSAAAKHLKDTNRGPLGLLWVDAHADLNTDQGTPSGNIHGMGVAALLGIGAQELTSIGGPKPKVLPEHVVYVGLRDLDPPERVRLRELPIRAYTMRDIDTLGLATVMRQALSYLNAACGGFVVSFDLDVCDPAVAPGVGTPVRGGLTFREAHLVMEMVAEMRALLSVEVVELNPACDPSGHTVEHAIALLESALGKAIL